MEPKAPTTVGIVEWSVDVENVTEGYIDFGLTEDYGMRAPVELGSADFRTLLLGMKPEQTYHFRVVVSDGSQLYASNDYTVETGAATTAVEIGSFDVKDEAGRERGFIVSSYWQGTSSAVVYVLDPDGDIVWWYDTGIAGGIARARLSADGKNVWITTASNNGNPIQRVSIDGLNGQTYAMAVGSHDLTPVTGAQMAFIEYGEADCNSIYLIEPDTDPTEFWDSEEVFGGSGCHGNALRYSAKEDVFTFSDVSTDVVVVDRRDQGRVVGVERQGSGRQRRVGRAQSRPPLAETKVSSSSPTAAAKPTLRLPSSTHWMARRSGVTIAAM